MIRQNRAVPILLVLTFAFILYLAGCFGAEEAQTADTADPTPQVVPTPTPAPVVTTEIDPDAPVEEPFFYAVEEGDRLGTIAAKFGVPPNDILRANPDLNPNVLIVGEELRIPGATTNPETAEALGPDRPDGVPVDYVVEPGDTLGAIAEEYTVSLDALLEANPEVDPTTLQPNDLLIVPPYGTGLDPSQIASRSTPVPIEREPGEPQTHIVEPGDFLSAIAEIYSVTVAEIVEANGLPNGGNEIQVGDELLIPPPSLGIDDTEDDTGG